MSHGLKIWDAAGNLTLDTSDTVGRVIGYVTLAAGHGAGTITDSNFSTGTPFCIIYSTLGNNGGATPGALTGYSFSGNDLNYTAGEGCTLVYGVA